MFRAAFLSGLPLGVYSRLESLFFHVQDIKTRGIDSIYCQLVEDFEAMAIRFVDLCKADFMQNPDMDVLKLHEAVDKLTQEWHTVIELIATVDLGKSFLDGFQPFIRQAAEDIGLAGAGDQFILIPTFGEYFALTRFEYSSAKLAMLKLPLSVINAPWEWSVFWHEVAGLKVEKITTQLQEHLAGYAAEKKITADPGGEEAALINTLFERILNGNVIDSTLRGKLQPILKRATGGGTKGGRIPTRQIWSLDWLEQLFEDACSVLAFGENFPFVFEKLLGRDVAKLNGDHKHPDLQTRVEVAKRLLALKNGSAAPAADSVERLTDELLWSFIQKQTVGSEAYLPVAFEKPVDVPELRGKMIDIMAEFKRVFDVVSPYPASLVQKIEELPGNEIGAQSPKESEASTFIGNEIMQRKLDTLFSNSELKALLQVELSQTDPFDIRWHALGEAHQGLSINVHNQDHSIWVAWHV